MAKVDNEELAAIVAQIRAMQVEHIDPNELQFADYNPRTMPSAKRAKLKKALTDFGFVQPVVARREDKLLIGGHQRVDCARELKFPVVPVVFLDGVTDERAMALNVVLNNEEIQGEWDPEKLAEVMQSLTIAGLDATLTGFTDKRVEEILSYTPPAEILPTYEAVTKTHHIKIGIYDIPLSATEYERLLRATQSYAAERGVLFGMVTWLLKPENAARF
jgi:hypothetical protein